MLINIVTEISELNNELHAAEPSSEITVVQLIKKFAAFHYTRYFITMFTKACNWYCSGAVNPVDIFISYLFKISLNISLKYTPIYSHGLK
jgi:hypothetical protein